MESAGKLYKVYKQAADVIEKVSKKKGTIKSLALAPNILHKKQTFALSSETLKYRQVIEHILNETKLIKQNSSLKKQTSLLHVVVYDVLFGKGKDLLKIFAEMKKYVVVDHTN